jgi:GT2 family glycosyltransferase
MPTVSVPLLVLNYNGRALLEECLPSILCAAAASLHDCRVWVIDNGSTDDSLGWLAGRHPEVGVIQRTNRGLCSFNDVLAGWDCPVALLLNNDVKLEEHCVDPLVEPLLSPVAGERPCFMTAPLCWQFDGRTCEGLKTAVRWRFGLVQATGRFRGHERVLQVPGLTASAGAILAVDRRKFVELGGFDPLYLPGRIEDLDFAFRGYMAGYQARYVPRAIAYHKGLASFGPAFTRAGCDHLALRNTLLFQWKNLRHPLHVARQLAGLPLRVLRDLGMAPFVPRERRLAFIKALRDAVCRLCEVGATQRLKDASRRERLFFGQFHPRVLRKAGA